MSAPQGFPPPPVGQHTHIMAKSYWQKPYCRGCGYKLGFLLDTQAKVEIVMLPMPLFWTAWRTPRTDELARA